MRVRRSTAAGLLVLFAVIGGRLGPRVSTPPTDPSLALEARATVPAAVGALLRRGCFDCHSNETRWPWYSRLAPTSWLVAHDVEEGRGQLNFSEWGGYNPYDRADLLDKMCDNARKRKMPLWQYRLLHAGARLNEADVKALCGWADAEVTRLLDEGP